MASRHDGSGARNYAAERRCAVWCKSYEAGGTIDASGRLARSPACELWRHPLNDASNPGVLSLTTDAELLCVETLFRHTAGQRVPLVLGDPAPCAGVVPEPSLAEDDSPTVRKIVMTNCASSTSDPTSSREGEAS
jgi:hypothetical protein